MRVTFAILVHKHPEQVARFVRALAGDQTHFVIHVDQRVDEEPFRRLLAFRADVTFVDRRVKVMLFSYRVIEAELRCVETALAQKEIPDRFVLLSGQDYPLKSAVEIRAFFAAYPGKQFVEHFPISPNKWQHRLDHYYFNSLQPTLLQRVVNKAAKMLPKRTPPLRCFGGSMWVNLTGECAAYVLRSLRERSAISTFLRHVHVPDEIAIQTLLMNSSFALDVVNDSLHCIRWQSGAAHPDTFGATDFDMLIGSGKLFARKFDASDSATLLDRIDSEVHRF